MPKIATSSVLPLWRKMSPLPGGKLLFSWMIGRRVPYSGSVSPRILELSPGRAVVRMRDRRGVRNHLESVHAVALVNLGELATGLALSSSLPAEARSIPTRLSIEFLKKARGAIVAESRCENEGSSAERESDIRAELRDPAGEVVARVTARWRIGPRA